MNYSELPFYKKVLLFLLGAGILMVGIVVLAVLIGTLGRLIVYGYNLW